jgi:group I intron endonuclease
MKGFIYCITNATNGKRYIEQTTQPVKYRFRQHLTMRLVPRQVISKAISKHGVEAFSVETLEEYDLPKKNCKIH